ncbi:NHLP leader peptide family RiPP precursor [Desulfovibrio inopinatus]|uniref:NHLP leader peptide family RiPP precursor n=1 Tax=Desulfovibrio inopinatus TaxID=102109 RepID=UPI000413588A|nr:NHLP leader peptide family RiPP precursor [Desulfovibrio inopinatus]
MPEKTLREAVTEKVVTKAKDDAAFKQELLADPKSALEKHFGLVLPEAVTLEIKEETPNQLFLVLPIDPSDVELPEDVLQKMAGGDWGGWDCV